MRASRPGLLRSSLGVVVSLCALLFAASCGPGGEAGPPSSEESEALILESSVEETRESTAAEPVEVEVSTLVTGLELPWDADFLPNGDALVTERDSNRILRVGPDGDVEEEQTIDEATGGGEGGLLGLALSPDYEEDGLVYIYYTTSEDNRVARLRLGEDPEPVFTGIPAAGIHNGGRIDFGPDGMLYVGTGDANQTQNSQNESSPGGKILRLTPNGEIPDDNPVPENPLYSLGHRNVQGLAWDEDGRLFASEFGQNAFDEVNRVEAGENHGWPEVEGEGGEPEYADPVSTWPTSEASPSGAEILRDGAIPQWEGDFFMAALRGERLWRLDLRDGEVVGREDLLVGEYGRMRHVTQAPDGSLWVLSSNGSDDRIIRVGPQPEE